jgi:hypothetical protein
VRFNEKLCPILPLLLEELLLEKPPVETKPLELVDELLLEKLPEDELLLAAEDEPLLLEDELFKLEPLEELVTGLSPSDLQPTRKTAKVTHKIRMEGAAFMECTIMEYTMNPFRWSGRYSSSGISVITVICKFGDLFL